MATATQPRQSSAESMVGFSSALGWLRLAAAMLLLLSVLVGIIVRLSVRDHVPGLAVIYYALPAIALAGLNLAAALLFRASRRQAWSRAASLVGLVCLGWWLFETDCRHAAEPTADSHRVLFWNTARGTFGWKRLADEIRGHDAELVGLVEAGVSHDQVAATWGKRLPEYQVRYLGRGMVLCTKGTVLKTHNGPLGDNGRYALAEVALDERDVTVILVDISSALLTPRQPALEALAQLAAEHAQKPVLIMGDFNTPIDSVHLAGLRAECANAFESAGNGLHVTWPVPAPVLALDQVWANRRVRIEDCRLGWSWWSDHRPVTTSISLEPPSVGSR